MKFIIFDLDETLGYFKQLYYIFSVLKKINASFNISQPIFNRVVDLYPEFLRPNILEILLYLKQQKQFNRNTYLIIYTNNTHPNWTRYIQSYIEYKLAPPLQEEKEEAEEAVSSSSSSSLFDKIIHAQKHDACRQHQRKNLDDLFRCIDYSSNSPICYIDNEFHPGMKSRQTHYCKLSGYVHNLSITVVADRLKTSGLLEEIIPGIHDTIFTNIYRHYCENKYTKSLSDAEYRYEVRMSQELMVKIRNFFMNSTTHKRRHTYSSLRPANTFAPSVGSPESLLLPSCSSYPPLPSTELVSYAERHSETTISRVADPLFNYYHNLSFRHSPSPSLSPSASSSVSLSNNNHNRANRANRTKKNRRVI